MGLSLLSFALVSACASHGNGETYPRLNEMPSLPQGVTPQAGRQKIIDELEKDEAGAPEPARKQPAVPPLPAPVKPSSGSIAPAEGLISDCEMDTPAAQAAQIAQAVPPLRGTLHGSWHAAVPPTGAAPPKGEGITAAVAVPVQGGPLIVGFAPGSAKLGAVDVAALKARAATYILNGGSSISIGARGGALGAAGVAGAKPLATLSLGMKRTSAIADVLIKAGIGAEQIKMSAVGDRNIPALAAKDWNGAGPDDAVIVFDIPTP